MSKVWLIPVAVISLLYCGYHLSDDLFYQSKVEQNGKVLLSKEVRAEQEQVLAQLALRNSMHAEMTEKYVQARVFTSF